jgi:hypothetical protein
MLDITINIENADILALMKVEEYVEAITILDTILSDDQLPLGNQAHLLILKAYCNYKLQRYPIAINTLGKILKHRYSNEIEHHVLSQAFYLLAITHMAHSKGRNKAKNRSTFIAISSSMNLLCYRQETIELMDDFLRLVGEK